MEGKSFESISYGDVKDKKLQYNADGDNPLTTDCCSPKIKLTISLVSDINVSGEDSAWVHCKNSPPQYQQGNDTWADSVYDHATGKNNKIRNQGCALSCLSMVMTAFGDTIDPGQLNTWMKSQTNWQQGGYTDLGGVSWLSPEKHVNTQNIKLNKCEIGHKMFIYADSVITSGDTIQVKKLNINDQISNSALDNYLSKCQLPIVEVYNSDTGNRHYVVVTGKENNRYTIIDPGGRNENYLDDYGGFWSLIVYKKA